MRLFLLFLISNYLTPRNEAKLVRYTLEISYSQGSPDGVRKNWILKINNQFPGPTLEAEVGDTLQIDVINHIKDRQNTTLHWHGIHQRGTPFQDGPSMITQCPLKYGQTQRYEFQLQQWGTYWYHGHVRSQYSEGLWGALIIHNTKELYSYSEELTISLSDWYHLRASENEEWYLSPLSEGFPPYPDSIMLNGRGRYSCVTARIKNVSCSVNQQRRHIYLLPVGRTYRLRVINTSSRTTFHFSIDGHKLQTIEVDGTDVASPVEVDSAVIAPAQRYSFLIRTDGSFDRYLIRATTFRLTLGNGQNINRFPGALIHEVTAVLQYDRRPNSNRIISRTEIHDYMAEVPPRVNLTDPIDLDEFLLIPYDRIPAPPTSFVNRRLVLNADLTPDAEMTTRFTFNQTRFMLPEDKPLLHKILESDPISRGHPYLRLGYMSVVQIVVNNFVGDHPFHLHGHTFWVVGKFEMRTDSLGVRIPFDEEIDGRRLDLNGLRRDTVLLPANSSLVIRFIADNPGVWIFHCHIDWHNLSGMAFVLIEGQAFARRTLKIPEESRRLCRV